MSIILSNTTNPYISNNTIPEFIETSKAGILITSIILVTFSIIVFFIKCLHLENMLCTKRCCNRIKYCYYCREYCKKKHNYQIYPNLPLDI